MKYLFRYLAATPRRLALYMIIAPVNAAVDVGLAYIMAIAIEFAIAGDLRQAGKYTLGHAPFMRDSEKRNHCDSRREHIICFPAQNSARSPTRAYTYG